MLVEAFARKETVQSSRIEGTQVTLSDVYRYEARQAADSSDRTDGARQAKKVGDGGRERLCHATDIYDVLDDPIDDL